MLLSIALLLSSFVTSSADYRLIPSRKGHVTDVANVLSAADKERLAGMIDRYKSETSHEIGVLLVPTLSGESIEAFSLRVANAWQLGRADVDNGILVVLAMRERKVRIELGNGMTKYISNAKSHSVITDAMVPSFSKGDYAGGIQAGLEKLMKEGRRFVVTPSEMRSKRQR